MLRSLLAYFWPFVLLKKVTKTSAGPATLHAENRAWLKQWLPTYIRRWIVLSTLLWLACYATGLTNPLFAIAVLSSVITLIFDVMHRWGLEEPVK